MPCMNKPLARAHMKSQRNRFLKSRSEVSRINYSKHRNYFVSLMRKTKKQYGNLNEKDAVDNKKFWKTVKLILSDKIKSNEKITIVEDGNLYPRHQSS